ncbi:MULTISPECIES: hypothetical protein [Paenibacillus]|uniref:hypothetical protein n=1 Tax=Paenibacillus TaxID=44249 RepID=UPI00038F92DE|nr:MULTISPECIES: hypothetical protein [Paenibacillus]CDN42053.1 hypothetical protein BN871_AT_00550 [Paenibacillus sp. P22]
MAKIDGRKARITNWRNWYDCFGECAQKLGYPDAVKSRRTRRDPVNDEIVTLLACDEVGGLSGAIWAVEATDGERYLIGQRGLEILPLTTEQLIEAKRKSIATLSEELATLEAQLAEEKRANQPKVGDYARVTDIGHRSADVSLGVVVRVDSIVNGSRPYKVSKLFGSIDEWDYVANVERLTPDEARAALIAEVDSLFR